MADQNDPTTPVDPQVETPVTATETPVAEPVAEAPAGETPVVDESAAPESEPYVEPTPAEEVVEAELVDESSATAADDLYSDVYGTGETVPPQYVVVEAPRAPRRRGNRGIGSLLALLGAVVFGAILAGITYLRGAGSEDPAAFLGHLEFYLPIIIFAIAFVLLVVIANRAQWWAYILGSLIVGLVVYFGTAASAVVLYSWFGPETPTFEATLASPFVIIAGVLAREVSIWWGSLIAHRGKRVTHRNRLAREAFDRDLAEFRAKYGQTAA